MRTGLGTVELPVPPGVELGGYADRAGGSTGVRDPLTVTVLTWSDGRRRAALAVLDVICVNADLTAAARAAVSHVDLLWLAATHTHAGPQTGCRPGGGPTPRPWRDRLVTAVRDATARAVAAERPGRAMLHTGQLRDVGAIRSATAPEPVVPLEVVVIGAPGDPDAVLVVVPVHPTVLPASNRTVSADLTGAARRALADRLGGVPVVVVTGAAGDISTRHTRRGQGSAELDRLGALVADRSLELMHGPGVECWSPGDLLAWRTAQAHLARRTVTDAPLAEAVAAHRAAVATGDPLALRRSEVRLQGARLAAEATPGGGLDVEVAALRVGRLAVAALPGEPFLALANAVRGARSEPTLVLGYANAYPGYLPTRAAYRSPEYEVLASVVAEGSGELLAASAHELITKLFPEG